MNKVRSLLNFLLNKSWQQKTEILKIFTLYLKFSLVVEIIPLRLYYKNYLEPVDFKFINNLQLYKRELSLIKKLGRKLPWKNKCIVECLVIRNYLSKLGINIPISLGVSLNEGFYAHAWCLPQHTTAYTEIRHQNEK